MSFTVKNTDLPFSRFAISEEYIPYLGSSSA